MRISKKIGVRGVTPLKTPHFWPICKQHCGNFGKCSWFCDFFPSFFLIFVRLTFLGGAMHPLAPTAYAPALVVADNRRHSLPHLRTTQNMATPQCLDTCLSDWIIIHVQLMHETIFQESKSNFFPFFSFLLNLVAQIFDNTSLLWPHHHQCGSKHIFGLVHNSSEFSFTLDKTLKNYMSILNVQLLFGEGGRVLNLSLIWYGCSINNMQSTKSH